MTAQIARQYMDGSKPDTPNGVSVANFQLGLGNAWDCLQTLGVGLSSVVAGNTTLTQANAGLLLIDATAGNVTLNLPAASAAVGAVFQFKRLDASANTVTVNRAGSDTIDGSTSFTLNSQFDYQEIRGDGTSAWRVTTPKPLVAATAGIATAYTVTTTPQVLAQADTRIQVTWNVSNGGVACTLAANGGTAYAIKQYDSTGTKIDPTIVAAVKSDLVFDGKNWVILDPLPPISSSRQIQPITSSVAANALTVGLNPTSLDFRSSTLTNGVPNTRTVASALSLVVPSGATLGTIAATAARLVLLAIDNAGTVELAIVNLAGGVNLDETTLISTTAISAAATSASVVYSTTARTNVPFRVVGFLDITEGTAGTWAADATLKQGNGGQATSAMSSLGYGQTWQNVTGSRALGTTYYNTTGKPITVMMVTNASANYTFAIGSMSVVFQSGNYPITFIVPAGMSYSITGSSLGTWTELR